MTTQMPTTLVFKKPVLVEQTVTYKMEGLRYAAVSGSGWIDSTIFGIFYDRKYAEEHAKEYLIGGYVIDLQTGERV